MKEKWRPWKAKPVQKISGDEVSTQNPKPSSARKRPRPTVILKSGDEVSAQNPKLSAVNEKLVDELPTENRKPCAIAEKPGDETYAQNPKSGVIDKPGNEVPTQDPKLSVVTEKPGDELCAQNLKSSSARKRPNATVTVKSGGDSAKVLPPAKKQKRSNNSARNAAKPLTSEKTQSVRKRARSEAKVEVNVDLKEYNEDLNNPIGATATPLKSWGSRHRAEARAERKQNGVNKIWTKLRVHKCTFLPWEVSSVSALASSSDGSLFAFSRENGTLELCHRDFSWTPFSIVRCSSSDETAAVSALSFDHNGEYLVVGRYNGSLEIYLASIEGLSLHTSLDPGGGAVLCIAARPAPHFEIAVGSEDGRVRVITVDAQFHNPELQPESKQLIPVSPIAFSIRAGDRARGMILSICWSPLEGHEGGLIVSGDSEGGLRWISGSNNQVIGQNRIQPVKWKKTSIWTVQAVHNGGQILCGDSRGLITIWSSRFFTLVEENRVQGMEGDIWCSAKGMDDIGLEFIIFGSAGGGLGAMQSIKNPEGNVRWVPIRGRRDHNHDLRGLAALGNQEFAVGSADARLTVFTMEQFVNDGEVQSIYPVHGCTGQNALQFVQNSNVVCSRRKNGVNIWEIQHKDKPRPVLALSLGLESFENDVLACALSDDLQSMAVSGVSVFRTYTLESERSVDPLEPLFSKVVPLNQKELVENAFKGAQHLIYVGSVLVGIAEDRQHILFLEKGNLQTVSLKDIASEALRFTHIAGCSAEMMIALSDSLGSVYVAGLRNIIDDIGAVKKHVVKCRASAPTAQVACMSFSNTGSHLALGLTDKSCGVSSKSHGFKFNNLAGPLQSVPTAVQFSPDSTSVLYSAFNFCNVVGTSEKSEAHDVASCPEWSDVFVLPRLHPMQGVGIIGSSNMLIAHRQYKTVLDALPPSIPRKIYGMQ